MKKKISIIGGGTSGLFLAAFLDSNTFDITIYEKNKTTGRKFLVAGKGGFNLTHSEPVLDLIARFTPSNFLHNALQNFTNDALRNWLKSIGIATYIGSSKRVYPEEGIKPITVLNAILKHLKEKHVILKYEHTFSNWDAHNTPLINNKPVIADFTIFSLGGASWKITGSNGNWLQIFQQKKILTKQFKASNCAFKIDWPKEFITVHEGTPLKNIAISSLEKTQKGEAVITKFGIEGNAIYGLSPQIRTQLKAQNKATIYIDLKPTLTQNKINSKITSSASKNTTQILKKELKLTAAQIALLKLNISKEAYLNSAILSKTIKKLPLQILSLGALDAAISTVGGVALEAIDKNYQLHQMPNQFCIGEMLSWDAPTGGYLIQGCASSGVYLAKHLNTIG